MVARLDSRMNNESHIRIQRRKSFCDVLRSYKVTLDGVDTTTLRNGETVTLQLTPGRHRLELNIDWCGSEEIQFDAEPGECVAFNCGSALNGWRFFLGLYYVCFRRRKYLFIDRSE